MEGTKQQFTKPLWVDHFKAFQTHFKSQIGLWKMSGVCIHVRSGTLVKLEAC